MLDEQEFRFDLPATEASLAGKTLGQLKLTSLTLIPRAGQGTQPVVLVELKVFAFLCIRCVVQMFCVYSLLSL